MGVLQMAESERSGKETSKEQEMLRKPSTESSQSPKAAEPSCLRGAFTRIFPKRAEPNNKTEEEPSSNQSTEDQEGVRGKKRKLTGSIFRLPCLRPAETTGNDIQDKSGEQSNDNVQEEELKPYSKASFLRKIRCYRLMREKDATEKEKVVEVAHRKHEKENVEVQQHKEPVLEQNEDGLQSSDHDGVVGGNAKDTSYAKSLEEDGNNIQGPNLKVEHGTKQEDSSRQEKESCTTPVILENPAKDLAVVDKDMVEHESCEESLQEKSARLEGEVSLDDKEQESPVEKKECALVGVKHQEEDMQEQKNGPANVGSVDETLSEKESPPEKPEKHLCIQDQAELPKKESPGITITDKQESMDIMAKKIPENKGHQDDLRDDGKYLSEQEDLSKENETNLSGEHLEEDTRNCLSEQDAQGLEDKDTTEGDKERDIIDKLENNVSHEEKGNHVEIGRDQENNMDNPTEETSHKNIQHVVNDTKVKTLGEPEDNSEVSIVSKELQDEQNFTNDTSSHGQTKTIEDKQSVASLGSEANKELPVSVTKTTANNILTCTSSGEGNPQILGVQKETPTLPNTMDLTKQEPQTIHPRVNNEEAGVGLGSLRVEVKDMVDWMVQEASDRLSNYTQEPEGTG
ncbi:hypothetical protein GDO81_003022 [Engystomops pustulosus]|uniref:Uncharacterized protein n=1 Tax=Engystomops pustulosus TaxID=76066 RepID=A0AAV7A354_ENGPU|nr:hypothetical protein GDO81_003022 [Engystomops pustulosus]